MLMTNMCHTELPLNDEQSNTQMINEKFLKKRSRMLSRILRHKPESVGITLDSQGYVVVDELLVALQNSPFPMDRAVLDEVVAKNDKQRFSYSADGKKIRANQEHSVAIDLDLSPQSPPDVLYHGTAVNYLQSIWQTGLTAQSRHHVHLSCDVQTAIKVGKRHGEVAVLQINVKQMNADGAVFYCSDNGVWLTECVPSCYLTQLEI